MAARCKAAIFVDPARAPSSVDIGSNRNIGSRMIRKLIAEGVVAL